MCIVAPSGITISLTSLGIPVSSETSRLVGIVATDEQVPSETYGRTCDMSKHRSDSVLASSKPCKQRESGKQIDKAKRIVYYHGAAIGLGDGASVIATKSANIAKKAIAHNK